MGDRPRLISVRLTTTALTGSIQLNQALSVHSIAGGDRSLAWETCPVCQWSADYVYRGNPNAEPSHVGQDPEIIRAALLALLSQPEVTVFTLVAREKGQAGDRSPLATYLVPRHQLPIFELDHDRGR